MINTAFVKLYQYNSPLYISTLVIQIAFLYNIRRHGRQDFNSWVGKIPWRRKWQPTAVFLPKKPMDRGAWWAMVQRVTDGQTWLTAWARAYQDEASFEKINFSLGPVYDRKERKWKHWSCFNWVVHFLWSPFLKVMKIPFNFCWSVNILSECFKLLRGIWHLFRWWKIIFHLVVMPL